MESHAQRLKQLLDQGLDMNAALGQLRQDGATPIETIKAIREANNVSLAEAKLQFSQCPAWSAEVEAADKLHEEIENAFKDL
ncbi:MAG: hypothetical protein Q8S00_05370 [Deltaproteobacteria bacterium]|nr:hypothetical protein [Deltaproteobacteria bacterium]MDZ4345325.1 hypothetical protein [Candidatus Binatia bacterium]